MAGAGTVTDLSGTTIIIESAKSDKKPGGTRPGKGQFKCFHCQKVLSNKDGDWHAWNTMEVYLCKPCDTLTLAFPERKRSGTKNK